MFRAAVVLGLALAANAQVFHYYPGGPQVFQAAEAGPEPCPAAPARPEGVDGCNWIPIQNSRGCILDYECEPKGPEPCPSTPMMPEDSHRCKWTAIKNAKGCIIDFECEPRRFRFHAAPQAHAFPYYGYPYGYHMAAPVAPAAPAVSAPVAAPVAAPTAGFDYGYWQRYFQAALQRGMAGSQGAQGFGQGQMAQGFGQQGGQGFQGQGAIHVTTTGQAGQGFGQQAGQGYGKVNQGFGQQGAQGFQGQAQNSYRPSSGVVGAQVTTTSRAVAPVALPAAPQPAQEYVWVYPEATDPVAPADLTPDAVPVDDTDVVVIPTGEEMIPTGIESGMPLTTGIRTRGAGSPRKH